MYGCLSLLTLCIDISKCTSLLCIGLDKVYDSIIYTVQQTFFAKNLNTNILAYSLL